MQNIIYQYTITAFQEIQEKLLAQPFLLLGNFCLATFLHICIICYYKKNSITLTTSGMDLHR